MRTPTFCPGCPHRDSSTVNLQMKKKFASAEKPMDIIFHGESGCHSMLQFAPNEGLMQNYSGMGLGGGTGAGMSPFVTNKQVVFLGDSTFFHSGMVAVSDSIKNNQDITYIILENGTTAMTGHQPTPGNDVDIMGFETMTQSIQEVLKGFAGERLSIQRVNPADRDQYQSLLEKTVVKPGVKVIIADKECAITLHRRLNSEKKKVLKEQGFLAREEKINITPDVCEYCLECTRQTGCPGLTVVETPYGRKIATDLSTCVDDGACARTKACPSFEKVIISRTQAPTAAVSSKFDFSSLPAPRQEPFHDRWSAYTAGVGGMGAGIVNAVLVRAGMKEGYDVVFLDKKGLAIRNGGVYGHIVFSKNGPVSTPVIPYGKADLLIGLDLLEAARGLDAKINLRVAHPARTHAVVNNHKHETVMSLMGKKDFDPTKLEEVIQAKVRLGGYLSADFSQLSEDHIMSKLYANMMILGAAYQKGWIPISEDNLMKAIDESVRKADIAANHEAFLMGRYFAIHPELVRPSHEQQSVAEIIEEKSAYLKSSGLMGILRARAYRKLMDQAFRWMDLSHDSAAFFARAAYDLVRYEGVGLAKKYATRVWTTYRRDQKKFGFQATEAVIKGLFRVTAIKDEVWVAQLLTAPEKYERDRSRYKIDASRGDKISYVHLNRPKFTIGRRSIEFDIKTRDWMLKIMRHGKFLRKLLPEWHAEEKAFRDWYVALVDSFTFFESQQDYELYVKALRVYEPVRGYREVRAPHMAAAKKQADDYLSQIKTQKVSSVFASA